MHSSFITALTLEKRRITCKCVEPSTSQAHCVNESERLGTQMLMPVANSCRSSPQTANLMEPAVYVATVMCAISAGVSELRNLYSNSTCNHRTKVRDSSLVFCWLPVSLCCLPSQTSFGKPRSNKKIMPCFAVHIHQRRQLKLDSISMIRNHADRTITLATPQILAGL